MTLGYLPTSTIVTLLPGTGVLHTLDFGIGKGWRRLASHPGPAPCPDRAVSLG